MATDNNDDDIDLEHPMLPEEEPDDDEEEEIGDDEPDERASDDWYVNEARKEYEREGECEIDDGATVSHSEDGGAYVAAWVWIYGPNTRKKREEARAWKFPDSNNASPTPQSN